jgi:hypothetical protein
MMAQTQHKEVKSRQRLANANMSKVQQLSRALQSGQLKRELRTIPESIHGARALYRQIELEGIAPKDFHVRIAFLTPDLSTLSTHAFKPGLEDAAQTELSAQCGIMVGLVFAIRDLAKENWSVGYRVFLSTPLIIQAFENYLSDMFVLTMQQ